MECSFVWGQQEYQKPKRRAAVDNNYTIKYPSDTIKGVKFEASEQISTFLLRNSLEIGNCKWQIFQKYIVERGEYFEIVYICSEKQCDSQLIYHEKKNKQEKRDGEEKIYLKQVKINNSHKHTIKLTPKLANQQNIRQYLFDLPVTERFENHVEVIKRKFNLSRVHATNLKQRVFWRFKNEDHMLRKLTERKITFRRKIQNGKTELLLILTETMRMNYRMYGDILCFDITYKLLMRKKDQKKHLGIGFFIGQDENCRIIIFGVSTIPSQASQRFTELFQYFFQIVQHVPQTILTDDQKAIGIALQIIREKYNYKFVHLLDWYHKMQNARRMTKRQPFREELFSLLCRALKEPSQQVILDIFREISTMLDKQQLMVDFLKDKQKCCISFVPPTFFAFGISSTRAEAFNALIKRSVPHQTNIGRLIYFVMRVQKRLNNRMAVLNFMNPELLRHILDDEILVLSNYLEHLALEQIRQYYEESRMFSIEKGKSPLIRYIPYTKYERKYKFNLMYDLASECWRCECKNNFRTGMPCSHIVKVVRENGGCVGYYINERWFHDKDNAQVKKETRPNLKDKRI